MIINKVCSSCIIYIPILVPEFLHQLADKDVVNRARNGWGLIEEDEVETIPEKLLPYKHIVLKSGLQNMVKCFFTDDGWMVAMNTIMMLEGIYYRIFIFVILLCFEKFFLRPNVFIWG